MRLTVFKILILIMLLLPQNVYAYPIPHISGEEEFNETAKELNEGGLSLNPIDIINNILEKLVKEVKESARFIVTIIFIAAISGVVKVLSDSFSSSISSAASFLCFVMMSTLALGCFSMCMEYGTDVIESICNFITKLTPVLVMALYASGNLVTASSFSPVLSGTVYVITLVIEKCLVPMICFSAVLSVAGNINEKVQVGNFLRVLKSVSKWIMVAIITIFTSISAAYGLSTPSLDAVSAKTVKFAVGSLVPVVGSFLSDTLDTVISGTRLMKNAVGVAGMITMVTMCLIPVIKIFIVQLIVKAGASLCEPIADKKISSMLWEMSESIMSIFAVVVMVMVLFIINIGIILLVTGF